MRLRLEHEALGGELLSDDLLAEIRVLAVDLGCTPVQAAHAALLRWAEGRRAARRARANPGPLFRDWDAKNAAETAAPVDRNSVCPPDGGGMAA